jgi:hypothetical protein
VLGTVIEVCNVLGTVIEVCKVLGTVIEVCGAVHPSAPASVIFNPKLRPWIHAFGLVYSI